jgi:hypothetical protein
MSRLRAPKSNLKPGLVLRFLALLGILLWTTARTAPSVSLAWEPSWDPDVSGYLIYYGTASEDYTHWVDAGSATNITITLPDYDTTYYFAATTYDAFGTESDFSNEASFSTGPADGTNPPPPAYTAPTLSALADLTLDENAGAQSIALTDISPGSGSSVSFTAASSNPSLIPTPAVNYTSPDASGWLTFTPAPGAAGSAVITVTANNGEPANNLVSRSFTVTIHPVYLAPTLAAISDVTIDEGAAAQTISLSGISPGSGQAVTFTTSSSNPALIAPPTISYSSPDATGTLSFKPEANAAGSAVITVTANNGEISNNIVSRSFTVTVNPVYTAPTLSPIADISLKGNAGTQTVALSGISTGSGQAVTLSATSSDPSLIPAPVVNYTSPDSTGSLTFASAANASGSATITVVANNGEPSNNIVARSFTVTVAAVAVNQAPTLDAIGDVTVNYNASAQTITLTGISAGGAGEVQPLAVKATSSNARLIPTPGISYKSPLATGSLTFKPKSRCSGTAIITVTVNDGAATNNLTTRSFKVTVLDKASSTASTTSTPKLSTQPKSQLVLAGKAAKFTVKATGAGRLKYQWKYNGVDIPGATRAALNLRKCSDKEAGLYTVTVSNEAGATGSTPAALVVSTTPAATLMSSARTNGQFSFDVVGVTDHDYAVEISNDLSTWTPVQTNAAPFTYTDVNAGAEPRRFYRAVYLP